MLKGAIFDFDGTLADSLGVWLEVDRRFLSARGLPCPTEYTTAIRHLNFETGAAYTVDYFNLQETPEAVLREWHDMALAMYRTEVNLKPGAKEYVEFLHSRHIKLALATSSVPALCTPLLKKSGLLKYFSVLVTAAEVPVPKTQPDIFLQAAADLELKPEEVVVYEDLAAAIGVAGKAGFHTVGIYDRAVEDEWLQIQRLADFTYRGFEGQIAHSPFNQPLG